MKKIIILAILFAASCRERAMETVRSNNSAVKVELLFEVDGCKVYRFWDSGYKYFTKCNGSVQWDEHTGSGKNRTTIRKEIQTSGN